MGKKKAAEEKVKATREKEFDDDMTSIDGRPVLREILPYTGGLYNTRLDVGESKFFLMRLSPIQSLRTTLTLWLASSLWV